MLLVIQYTLIFTTVLALVALGGMFSERSGVINLGLEGIMVIGALAGAISTVLLGKWGLPPVLNVIISILASIVAGWLYSMLLGVACITFKADQTITGTALNIMSTALAVVIARMYTKTPSSQIMYDRSIFMLFKKIPISFLQDFELSIFVVLMALLVVSSFIFLFKTKFGLRLMACGEQPQAAASVGINVYVQRYLGVSLSGILGGLGGFAYIVQSGNYWDFKNGVAGFGFLALAVMIFGQWKPVKILLAALLFGFCQTISILYSGALNIPQFVYKMLPYIVCMIVLAITSKKSRAPKAEGIPYDKSQR